MTDLFEKDVECTDVDGRALSPSEAIHWKTNQLENQQGTYFHINILDSTKEIEHNLVRQSLHRLSKLHFLLRAKTAKNEHGNYLYKPMEGISDNLDWVPLTCMSTESISDWVHIVTKDLKQYIDFENGPLWRALWVSCPNKEYRFSYMFILICTHAIIDAKSAVDLSANQFLPILNSLVAGKDAEVLTKPIYLAKPLEEIYMNISGSKLSVPDFPIPWYVKAIFNLLLWKNRMFSIPNRKPNVRVVEEQMSGEEPCHYPFDIGMESSTKLLDLCRKYSVSIHSVLLLVMAHALNKAKEEFEHFSISTKHVLNYTIDLRKFNKTLSTSPLPLGVFVNYNYQNVQPVDVISEKKFFRNVQCINGIVKSHNVSKGPGKAILGGAAFLLRNELVGNLHDKFGFPEMIYLSNVGNCDSMVKSNSGDIKLVGQYFNIAIREGLFLTTSTVNDCMYFCIGCDSRWCTQEFMKFLADEITNSILALVKV